MIKKCLRKIFIGDKFTYKTIPINLIFVTITLFSVLVIKKYWHGDLTFHTIKNNFENEVLFPVLGYSIGYVPISIIKIHNKKGCS